jgi:hypothetical protein
MGLWDRLSGIGSGIGSAIESAASVAAREFREFGGALLGGVGAGAAGRGGAGIVAPQSLGGIPEFLGSVLGAGVGTGLRVRVEDLFKRETIRRSPAGGTVGTAGTNPVDTTPLAPTVISMQDPAELRALAFETLGVEEREVAVASALPGGALIARGAATAVRRLRPVLEGLVGGIGAAAGLELFGGGETVANGALTLPGAAPGSLYRIQGPSLRARSLVAQQHPTTGDIVYWRYVGKARSFSGDKRIAKGYAREHGMTLARRGSRKR